MQAEGKKRPLTGFTIVELLLVFVIVVVVMGLMQPAIRESRREVNRTNCANNLRQLGRALYIYAKEHDGVFPPAIDTLYSEQYLADKGLLDCPATKKTGTGEDPDYVYTQNATMRSDSLGVLLRDKEGNHVGGMNAVLVNGKLVWQEESKG